MSDAAAFAEHFTAGWANGRDGFVEHFLPRVDPDVLLVQPIFPAARGHEGFRELFDALYEAIPDLRGDVTRWAETDDGLIIEMVFSGTVGGRRIELANCDRIVLRDGLMIERHAHFAPSPLILAMAARPLAAAPVVRSLVAGRHKGKTTTRSRAATTRREPFGRALASLALGRIVLGLLSRSTPQRSAELFGAGSAMTPELDYMAKVFGARAFALGTGYLTSSGTARRRWQRLAFVCDVSDTVAGIGSLRRRHLPRSTALGLTAMTAIYALIGGARIANDVRSGGEAVADV
jgi:hypothetical protein